MTNYERLHNMTGGELGSFFGEMAALFMPEDCEKCLACEMCNQTSGTHDCGRAYYQWLLEPGIVWDTDIVIDNFDLLKTLGISKTARFLGNRFGRKICAAESCEYCPAYKQCSERDANNCVECFYYWLEDEAEEEEDSTEDPEPELDPEPEPENEQIDLSKFHSIDSSLIYLCAKCNDRLEDVICEIIDRYEHGCACVYCPKSAVPNRSPDKEVCTPADCARGLAEYLRRMED